MEDMKLERKNKYYLVMVQWPSIFGVVISILASQIMLTFEIESLTKQEMRVEKRKTLTYLADL